MVKFSPVRDISAGVVSLMSGGVGLVGLSAKKFFIAADDSFTKKFLVGVAAAMLTGGLAIIPYLLAAPGLSTKAELAAARHEAVAGRY